jgi:OOP family OmpA-OmpF porin
MSKANGGLKSLLIGLTGIAVLIAAPAALSQASGFYAGGSVGQSKAKDTNCVAGLSCDDTDTAWKIFGGYQINRNFAAELGYTNLGKFESSGLGISASVEAKALELVGVGLFPLADRLSVYGKLGGYHAKSEGRSNIGVSADKTNTGLTFGLGAQYDILPTVGLRAEWQRYHDVGGGDIKKTDIDVLGIAALFRF